MKTAAFTSSFSPMIPPREVSSWFWEDTEPELDAKDSEDLRQLKSKIGSSISGNGSTYIIEDLLGVGTFAAVYKTRDVITRKVYAVKCVMTRGLTEEQLALQRMEAEIHMEVQSVPNVVRFHDTFQDDEWMYIVLEYCADDMFNIIKKPGVVLTDAQVKSYFVQTLEAVSGMHKRGIYHRDLKPENLLLGNDGGVRVADFGLATKERWSEEVAVGTRSYLAPEVLDERADGYRPGPADVWALGVVLVNLRFQCKLWNEADAAKDDLYEEFLDMGADAYFSYNFSHFSKSFRRLLKRIFQVKPEDRPTVDELRKMVQDSSLAFRSDSDEENQENIDAGNEGDLNAGEVDEFTVFGASCDSAIGSSLKKHFGGCESKPKGQDLEIIEVPETSPDVVESTTVVQAPKPMAVYRPPFESFAAQGFWSPPPTATASNTLSKSHGRTAVYTPPHRRKYSPVHRRIPDAQDQHAPIRIQRGGFK